MQVRNPLNSPKWAPQWMFSGSGPMTVGAGQVGGAACTQLAVGGRPDVQFNVMPLSVDKPGDPLHAYPDSRRPYGNAIPRRAGGLRSGRRIPVARRRSSRVISPRKSTAGRSSRAFACCARFTRSRLSASCSTPKCCPAPRADTTRTSRFRAQGRRNGLPLRGHVPHGRCERSGGGRRSATARARCRALRVIDASVMPTVTSANTNAASLMIGERGAALVMS